MLRFGLVALTGFLLVGAAAGQPATEKLEIVTGTGPHDFKVEVMRSEDDRERGLMYRRTLAPDHGMLFDFETAAPVMMWMKNTFLPLDMVFIGKDGKVISTAENAVPLSEKVISSGGDALGVLEVNAGTVASLGVKRGDRVINGMFP